MARTKHIKINQVRELPNVFSSKDENLSNRIKDFFSGKEKYTLELGCGHGDYSVELAAMYPSRNFIGIDIKAARIFNGAQRALDQNLNNAAFLISQAENISEIFSKNSIEEIYIAFPDPHVKRKSEPRRLVSNIFLEIYKSILTKNGKVHLKTDNEMIFNYTLKTIQEFGCKVLRSFEDLYSVKDENLTNEIKTKYEQHYLKMGRIIKYICFQF
ncbi:MAG: tRNA (guanosine(46)-N7)-methyltransferase TrmB [Ignavibacteria bacterium]|nr:tRNA (guanosine(46)-N7)-methyltransferase TrmB [Ignavibacteria bacterium]MBT8383828.1 tRNA (guanosine(46)-N7)-methyltransferase TrmB [Ignavibacteria bacterium]MBT8390429.1 tRNA (guanosine(46)-N7)-methyltransferase TrmB [Ignavibacteria bacterium]NNJ51970.1 tRNA (guanosine(46)-N7)-methyltransferase TrmB [Ignavibacteriaceae bacterium]NNL20766.1 tRNA (guanosine(46)-N7)-methyltransferase TrmB [Ignavibacteriaceae bacterium]